MQATGPPAKMAANREDLTPMMSQYYEICTEFEDSLVLFQVGDFYEAFCEAAETAARTLEITLTKREDSSGTYPMAGIPIDNATSYIETLLQTGYRVAIADQVQDPSEASGVVDRAVTRVVTPGTILDSELLDAGTNNYLACLTTDENTNETAVAFLDISTGEFRVTSDERNVVQDELDRLGPAEVITGSAVSEDFDVNGMYTSFRDDAFEIDTARDRVAAYVPNPSSVLGSTAEIRACGALLAYAEYTQGVDAGGLEYISRITRYVPEEAMRLDATALRSLEVFENREGGDEHTVLGVLDRHRARSDDEPSPTGCVGHSLTERKSRSATTLLKRSSNTRSFGRRRVISCVMSTISSDSSPVSRAVERTHVICARSRTHSMSFPN